MTNSTITYYVAESHEGMWSVSRNDEVICNDLYLGLAIQRALTLCGRERVSQGGDARAQLRSGVRCYDLMF
jgi:hypothetical protein